MNRPGRNNLVDVTGKRFGMLTAVRKAEVSHVSPCGRKEKKWILKCDCGKEVERTRTRLKTSKTCGTPICRYSWTSKVFAEKRSKKAPPVSSWKRMTSELKGLRTKCAQLEQRLAQLEP